MTGLNIKEYLNQNITTAAIKGQNLLDAGHSRAVFTKREVTLIQREFKCAASFDVLRRGRKHFSGIDSC